MCVCVCVSVQAITFKLLKLGTLFLAYKYITPISRSSLNIKVVRPRSRSNEKLTFCYLTATSLCLYPTKAYLKGQGHLKVNVTAM